MLLSATPFYQHTLCMPTRPSPLAERPPNVPPRAFQFTMASQSHLEKKAAPQRPHKPNPLVQDREAATQRRRDMFFRRVQRDRDDKKWGARGEQIQRLDFVTEQKRWEAEKARQAPEINDQYIEESLAEDVPSASTTLFAKRNDPQSEREIEEAEYILAQEEDELQALITAMEEEQDVSDQPSQHYGSDDDDYDRIFLECTSGESIQMTSASAESGPLDPDAMDMTDG